MRMHRHNTSQQSKHLCTLYKPGFINTVLFESYAQRHIRMTAQQFNCYIYWYMPKPKIALPAIVMQQPQSHTGNMLTTKEGKKYAGLIRKQAH